jgi:hypothetical protein
MRDFDPFERFRSAQTNFSFANTTPLGTTPVCTENLDSDVLVVQPADVAVTDCRRDGS